MRKINLVTAILLTESDVESLVGIGDAIDVVEEAFREWAAGRADNVPRRRARAPGIVLHSMCASAEYLGRSAWKQYTTTRSGARFLVGVYQNETGQLEALIEADRLGQLRTGAASGVAVKYLADADTASVGILGSGWQAQSQLAAVAGVRPIKSAKVYSRSAEKREQFAQHMSDELAIEVTAADTPRDAVANMPVVITATSSRAPVFDGNDIAIGAVVCAMGSNAMNRSEIDTTAVRRAGRVVCDSIEACQIEAGDFADAIASGEFDWRTAEELRDTVSGDQTGRSTDDEIVIFKSVGLALEDLALASLVVDRAGESGAGQRLPF